MDEVATPQETTSDGRLWAMLSYGGLLVGIPLGLVPLIQRNDAYALYHAKQSMVIVLQAAALFAVWVIAFGLSMLLGLVTCGLSNFVAVPVLFLMFFLLFLPVIPLIHGIIITVNGEWTEPVGVFGLGDRVFSNVQIEEKDPQT